MRLGSLLIGLGAGMLILIGLTMVSSVSDAQAIQFNNDANHFALHQITFAAAGAVVAFLAVPRVPYTWLKQRPIRILLLLAAYGGLVATLLFAPEEAVKGARRWIRLGPLKIQPSEFVRVALCVFLAAWSAAPTRRNEKYVQGILIPGLLVAPAALMLIKQPDYGSAILLAVITGVILFSAGVNLKHLALSALPCALLVLGMLLADTEHRNRILAFVKPDILSSDETLQIEASLSAFRRGGLFGRGLHESIMKEGFLPEAHTDFILAVTGEELGLFVTILVLAGYVLILSGGFRIARATDDKFGKLLAIGLTCHLAFAGAANIAVVTRFAPTKGLALPFMSYGGSNMLASCLVLGLLFSVARHARGAGLFPPPVSLNR